MVNCMAARLSVFGFGKPRNREEHRYYLLPGMGKANRRKHALYFKAALIFGVSISLLIGLVMWIFSRPAGMWLP